jgi:hypothetical protein
LELDHLGRVCDGVERGAGFAGGGIDDGLLRVALDVLVVGRVALLAVTIDLAKFLGDALLAAVPGVPRGAACSDLSAAATRAVM